MLVSRGALAICLVVLGWNGGGLQAQRSPIGVDASPEKSAPGQASVQAADQTVPLAQQDGYYLGGDDPKAAGQVSSHRIEQAVLGAGEVVWQGEIELPDGRRVLMTKRLNKRMEVESTYVTAEGRAWTREELQQAITSAPARSLHPDLERVLAKTPPGQPVTVLITLKQQPHRETLKQLNAELADQLADLATRFRRADGAERAKVQDEYDTLTRTVRQQAAAQLRKAQETSLAGLFRWVQRHGGEVGSAALAHGMLSARLPARWIGPLAHRAEVLSVDLNHEAEAELDVSVPTVGASAFWAGGFQGGASGFEPGILDSGLDANHPALPNLQVLFHIDHYWASRNRRYNDSWTNPDDYHGHGTAVTGIVASRGSFTWEGHVGMAPGVARLYNLKSAYRKSNGSAGLYFSDAIDNIDWGIFDSTVDDIDLLNFSYGVTTTSDDNSMARFMDAVVDDLDIPVIVAAGNAGPSSQTIVNPGNAYNILCVASMNDINTTNRSDDVIAYSSSRGPTRGGRKKPDITAPGAYIQTLNRSWETQLDFTTWSGTSFAAPHVTGATLLLMDYYGPPVEPKRIKAVLLNSAGKWGSIDWNSTYGWGYLDLQKAWENRDACFVRHVSPEGASDDFDLYLATFRPQRDTATLAWNRHVVYAANGNYPSTWYGLNDLDLNLYDHQTGQLIDVSASGIDNVEQVWYQPTEDTQCVIRVEAEDTSFNAVAQEQYALAGPPDLVFPANLPHINVTIAAPNVVAEDSIYQIQVTLDNSGDINAVQPTVTLTLPPGHTVVNGSNPQQAGTLIHNGTNQEVVSWDVQAPGVSGTGTISIQASSFCWGETWDASAQKSIQVRRTVGN